MIKKNWDEIFFTDFALVEKEVKLQEGSYQGLEAQALLTSSEDFERIFEALPEIHSWVELGSGHGLGPLMFGFIYPHKKALGLEFDLARFKASTHLQEKHHLPNVTFLHADLLTSEIPAGDAYFLYFPTGPVLDRILFVLGQRDDPFKLIVIESHGDLLPRLSKESWLEITQRIPLSSQRHHPEALVFTNTTLKAPSLHDLSFVQRYLILKDQEGEWLGESQGLEWLQGDTYQLQVPPRSFEPTDLISVVEENDLDALALFVVKLRRLGNLRVKTLTSELEGSIRKIHFSPVFKVEISSGERLQWLDVRQIFRESTLCFDSSLDYYFLPHAV